MPRALSILILILFPLAGCQNPEDQSGQDSGISDGDGSAGSDDGGGGIDAEDGGIDDGGDQDGTSVADEGDAVMDTDDSVENTAPQITSQPPIAAAETVAYYYQLDCSDSDGDILQLVVTENDTCGGTLVDTGNGLATYSFLPSDGQGGTQCLVEVDCSDSRLTDTQTSGIAISDVTIGIEGRFVRLEPISYPGLEPRAVLVYLPADYHQNQSRYPVLYLHDGQNLFDADEAAFGVEWEVDETIDTLTSEGIVEPHLVVGIYNTSERISDYTPDADPTYGGGNGDRYADFVVQLLKPVVDALFRTRPEREHNSLVGSSLGGIISLHIHERYPEVFGGIGCVSPSLWWNDRSPIQAFATFTGMLPLRLWLDMGTAEGGSDYGLMTEPVENARSLRQLVLEGSLVAGDSFGYLEDIGATHDEASWAGRIESILWFLLSDTRPVDMVPSRLRLQLFHHQLDLAGSRPATSLTVEQTLEDRVRLTLPNQEVELESLQDLIASVDMDGLVTAHSDGTATIRAGADGLEDSFQVVVGGDPRTLVTFYVQVPPEPDTPAADTIFITGNDPLLGLWDAGAVDMDPAATDMWTITLALPANAGIEYKYTRGSWETVEKASDGGEIANRTLTPIGDSMPVYDTVERWAQ
jgi:predicted alpha/beta superfamily hydrolase